MEQPDRPRAYDDYLQQFAADLSDLDPAVREEILREVSAHLQDADEGLAGSIPDPAARAALVLAECGAVGALAPQFGVAHTGPTGRLQRLLAPAVLVAAAAGHLAAALTLSGLAHLSGSSPLGLIAGVLYLLLSAVALLAGVRYLLAAIHHPFRELRGHRLLVFVPLALLLAMWMSGMASQPSSATAFVYYATEDLFGSLQVGLAIAGSIVTVALRQRRWLLLWAAIHGLSLTANPFVLMPVLQARSAGYVTMPVFAPVLLLPWIYGSAAILLGLPLRRLLPWASAIGLGGLVLGAGPLVPSASAVQAGLLPSLLWLWIGVLPLPLYAWWLWRSCRSSRDPKVGDPTAALLLVPVPVGLALLFVLAGSLGYGAVVVPAWGARALASALAPWLWGTSGLFLGAAALLWTGLLAAVTAGLLSRRLGRPRRA